MGFLKFLKKKKEEDTLPEPPASDLDIPPAPPGIPDNVPDFPVIKTEEYPVEKEVIKQANEEKKVRPIILPEPKESHFFQHDEEEAPPVPMSHMSEIPDRPVFLKSKKFQQTLGRILTTRKLLKHAGDHLVEINEIKNKEEKEYTLWKSKLEDIQRKLIYVDKLLFEE